MKYYIPPNYFFSAPPEFPHYELIADVQLGSSVTREHLKNMKLSLYNADSMFVMSGKVDEKKAKNHGRLSMQFWIGEHCYYFMDRRSLDCVLRVYATLRDDEKACALNDVVKHRGVYIYYSPELVPTQFFTGIEIRASGIVWI